MEKLKRKSKVSLEDWINRCNISHNFKYDYSKVQFKHLTDEVTIICEKHGEFKKRADYHLRRGCNRCSKNRKFHIDDVKELLNQNRYFDILEFDVYVGNRQKIQVVCKKAKHVTTKSIHHLLSNNVGCTKCRNKYKLSFKEWKDICNSIHKNKYDYSLVNFKKVNSKVDIICPIHGVFSQLAFSHKNGAGCKRCNKSLGENIISDILDSRQIEYEDEKTFSDLKYKSNLYFDFYLPLYNLCIEFDGLQHHKSYDFFGGEEGLNERIERDKVKNEYCLSKKIRLLRLSYQINYLTKQKIHSIIENKIIDTLSEIKI